MKNDSNPFERDAANYDADRRALVPYFDAFYDTAADALCCETPTPHIIDLGAGTGILAARVRARYPHARLTLLDSAPAMLVVAKARFADAPDVRFVCADMREWQPETPCDAVVSALAIHHLEDLEKLELYAKIFRALKPGGVFVNAEQCAAETPLLRAIYRAKWGARLRKAAVAPAVRDAAAARMKADRCAAVSAQLGWLREIGFAQVDCPYKYYDFAVLWARKAHA